MPTTPQNTFDSIMLLPYWAPEQAREISVHLPVSVTYEKGQILGEIIGTDEIVTFTISGAPTGGDFTMTFGGQTTAAQALGVNAAALQTALEGLSSIGDGNIKVTGGWSVAGAVFRLEFRGALGAQNVGAVTATTTGLTGGSQAHLVTVTQGGATGTAGTYKAFDNDAVTGEERAVAILKYKCVVDSSGNITVGGGEHGEESLTAPAYVGGFFHTTDLTGLDMTAVDQLGRLVSGTVADGVLKVT